MSAEKKGAIRLTPELNRRLKLEAMRRAVTMERLANFAIAKHLDWLEKEWVGEGKPEFFIQGELDAKP
jgi:predicted transcriptional regulator